MSGRSRLVLVVSVLLSGMPLVAESAQITQDPTSGGPTITIDTPLAVNTQSPLTNEGNITITTTPPLTNNGGIITNTGSNSSTTSLVGVDGSPIQLNGASISPSTAPTTNGISTVAVTGTPAGVPEPGSLLLLGAGLAGLVGLRRRLSQNQRQD